MRTTLELPDELVQKAMEATHSKTKTKAIVIALENIIQREKIAKIKKYHGKLKLNIDFDNLRQR